MQAAREIRFRQYVHKVKGGTPITEPTAVVSSLHLFSFYFKCIVLFAKIFKCHCESPGILENPKEWKR